MSVELISLVGILIGVCTLIFLAFRGYPIFVIGSVASVIVLLFSGMNVLDALLGTYMDSFSEYISSYFFIFLLSSIFGRMMGKTGAAQSIAYKTSRLIRKKSNEKNHKFLVVMSLVIINMVLTLGGVSLFVVVFTVVEIAKELFEEFDVPWKMYTCGVLGSSSFTSTMVPGNPAIINIIPTNYLGTNTMAAPLLGIICAVITFLLGALYILLETKKNTKNKEGFFPTGQKIKEAGLEKVQFVEQPLIKCLIPSIVLILVLNVFSASAVVALTAACLVKIALFYKELMPNLPEVFKMGGENAMSAIVSICAAVGFGSVVASVPGYQLVINSLDSIPGPAMLQLVLSFNVISAVTGSSSGGASIAFSTLGDHFLDLGLSPQVIHRVGIMSSNGLDSLPHSGAIFNTLNITRLTHKQAYKNYFMLTVVLETGMSLFAGILAIFGIV